MYATRIISTAALGGLVLGALGAAMVPTSMKQAEPEWWRGQVASHKTPERVAYRFEEAGPVDLDPQAAPQPEVRALARQLAMRTQEPSPPIFHPSGYEGFEIRQPPALPIPDQVRVFRGAASGESPAPALADPDLVTAPDAT